jgi:FAD/FMN-containing dehydrogenase
MAQAPTGSTAVEALAERLAGDLIRPDEPGYDEARSVYNGMIDRRPAIVVRPPGAADVIAAVQYARAEDLPIAIKCGAHSVAGNGTCDDGLLLDLCRLKGVHVDPIARTARAAGGVQWGEFDHETQAFGLITPGGRVTTTGVGGFTLGGGYGWFSPKFGLTCDNLISADVVTAEGKLVHASATENPDLLWALKGGGGNFGVVTSFEFRLHEVGPIIYGGLMGFRLEQAPALMRFWRDFAEAAPDDLATATAVLAAPPEPFVPEELHGRTVFGIIAAWAGDPAEGEAYLRPLVEEATPVFNMMGELPYTAFQAMIDPFAPSGVLNYWKGLHLKGLPDEAIDAYVANAPQGFEPISQAIMFRHGGQVARIDPGESAFRHRDAAYMYHPVGAWTDPARTDEHLEWVFRAGEAMEPYGTGGVYLNFTTEREDDAVRAGYDDDAGFAKLVAVKDAWDPDNVFRFNHNIKPSSG